MQETGGTGETCEGGGQKFVLSMLYFPIAASGKVVGAKLQTLLAPTSSPQPRLAIL